VSRLVATAVCIAAATGLCAAASAGAATGRLAGQTQVSFGCPGPVAQDGPSCNPWRPFSHARFSVTALGGARSTTVASDGSGRFALRLAAGSYRVAPLAQAHTRTGTPVQVRVRAGATTRILVRFEGFPRMV
jgi:hypothetical protein